MNGVERQDTGFVLDIVNRGSSFLSRMTEGERTKGNSKDAGCPIEPGMTEGKSAENISVFVSHDYVQDKKAAA